MTRALAVALFGLLLVGVGLAASPWPWAALVVPGIVLAALGLYGLTRLEVADDDGT